MCSGPPTTITDPKARLPLSGRQAKHMPTNPAHSITPGFTGHEGREASVKALQNARNTMAELDFPITVIEHSPRIG